MKEILKKDIITVIAWVKINSGGSLTMKKYQF